MVNKIEYHDVNQKLYFNTSCYFPNVTYDIWEFKIGGYQVLDKYLKSRKGMDISKDLPHIQNIIRVLEFTIQKMKEIDTVK